MQGDVGLDLDRTVLLACFFVDLVEAPIGDAVAGTGFDCAGRIKGGKRPISDWGQFGEEIYTFRIRFDGMKINSYFLSPGGLNNYRAISIFLALDSLLDHFVDDCFDINFNLTVFQRGLYFDLEAVDTSKTELSIFLQIMNICQDLEGFFYLIDLFVF